MKTKLDNAGITDAASTAVDKVATGGKFIGGFIVSKATAAKNAVNGKIDEN